MELFAVIFAVGIIGGFVYGVAKFAEWLIKKAKDAQVYEEPLPQANYENIADIDKKIEANKTLIRIVMKILTGI